MNEYEFLMTVLTSIEFFVSLCWGQKHLVTFDHIVTFDNTGVCFMQLYETNIQFFVLW